MFDLRLGGIFLLIAALFLLSCVTFYIAFVIETGKLSLGLEEMRNSEKKHVEHPATWRDGAMAIGMDVKKYEGHTSTLVERYPMAMDNLIRLKRLSTEMDEDEKYRVRMEYETKFNQVVIDEERRRKERMNEEIEDILESFKENRYVGSTDESSSETDMK